MRKNNPILYNVLIESFAGEGKSLLKQQGKVIFVEEAVPGDIVDIELKKSKKDWAEAIIIHFHKKSELRINPSCEHTGTCGGCQWQVVSYKTQLDFKTQQIKDNFNRIGHLEIPAFLPIIGATEVFQYRNKLEYTFATERYLSNQEYKNNIENNFNFNYAAGFHAKGFFNKVVHINQCHLQSEPSNEIRAYIVQYALKNNLTFYNIKNKSGWIRNVVVRNNQQNQWLVNIVFGENNIVHIEQLCSELVEHFATIKTILYTLNYKVNDSLHDLNPIIFYGDGFLYEQLGKFNFKISAKSFFQTNTKQAIKLYDVVKKMIATTGNEIVYDLYCGTGSIGLYCSDSIKKLIGVELVESAIEDAKINAQINQVLNSHFFCGDVIQVCTAPFFKENGSPDVIIIDPPRAGLHNKLTEKLLEINAPTIVYVSCNPATQARDLQLLSNNYVINEIQPVDMFPHTKHIECVVKLIKK